MTRARALQLRAVALPHMISMLTMTEIGERSGAVSYQVWLLFLVALGLHDLRRSVPILRSS